jgi:hypothetical protein
MGVAVVPRRRPRAPDGPTGSKLVTSKALNANVPTLASAVPSAISADSVRCSRLGQRP